MESILVSYFFRNMVYPNIIFERERKKNVICVKDLTGLMKYKHAIFRPLSTKTLIKVV